MRYCCFAAFPKSPTPSILCQSVVLTVLSMGGIEQVRVCYGKALEEGLSQTLTNRIFLDTLFCCALASITIQSASAVWHLCIKGPAQPPPSFPLYTLRTCTVFCKISFRSSALRVFLNATLGSPPYLNDLSVRQGAVLVAIPYGDSLIP